jgi:Ca-activated chloride channel family protein
MITLLEVPPKASRRGGKRNSPLLASFLAVTASATIVSGLFFTVLPAVRASDGDGEPTVSITPRVSRRAVELKNRPGSIRVDVNLVLIPVTVTDSYERPVVGLRKSDFHLFEEGVEQEISQFFRDEAPISVGIVFDASKSMNKKMNESREAVRQFLKMSMPGDEFFLMKFSDAPEQICDFTTETKDIEDTLPSIQADGWTSLYDAISLGVNKIKHARHGRKVLLVLSDGGDNNSRFTEHAILDFVKEADVRIFSISILERSHTLEAIAEESGGRAFRVRKLDELPEMAAKVSAELHSEYVLGYAPTERPVDGKYRKLKVQLAPRADGAPQLHTSWKRGYYSPAP